MARNKNKNKSNAESVLDDVLSGQNSGQESGQPEAEAIESVEETAPAEAVQNGVEEPSDAELFGTDEYAAQDEVKVLEEPAPAPVPSKLTVSVSAPASKTEAKGLLWKSLPAGELEPLLRERAKHHAKMNYGIEVSLTQIDQPLMDKCASDYRFLREIEKLTRKF